MSFALKTADAMVGQVMADLASIAPTDQAPTMQWLTIDGQLRLNDYYVFGQVVGQALYEVQGFVDWSTSQYMPDTASAEYLERWGSVLSPGITRRGSQPATGLVDVKGLEGTSLPEGTQFQDKQGQLYTAIEGRIIVEGGAVVPVKADEVGISGNLAPGSPLTLTKIIAGIELAAQVNILGFSGGAGQESDDSLRTRITSRLQANPSTGSTDDLLTWAYSHPTIRVTRAWAFPVSVTRDPWARLVFMMDDTYVDGLPRAADELAMVEYLRGKINGTGRLLAGGPTSLVKINLIIEGLRPNTPAMQFAVKEALKIAIAERAEPGLPNTAPPTLPGVSFSLSWLQQAIANATGETSHRLVSPAQDISLVGFALPVLGEVSFQ